MADSRYTLEEVKETVHFFAQCDFVADFFRANKEPTGKQIQDMVNTWWAAIHQEQ